MPQDDDIDNRFYEALKKSHPIAFLTSLSMLTTVFSATNLPAIYNNMVMATMMFLISLVLSLMDQFFPGKDPSLSTDIVRYGKFFFLAIGILYLISIAFEFAKDLPEISTMFFGWIIIGVGFSFVSPVVTRIGKFRSKDYPDKRKFRLLIYIGYGSGAGFIIAGIMYILNAFAKNKLSNEVLLYIMGGLILFSIICIISEMIIITKFRKPIKT